MYTTTKLVINPLSHVRTTTMGYATTHVLLSLLQFCTLVWKMLLFCFMRELGPMGRTDAWRDTYGSANIVDSHRLPEVGYFTVRKVGGVEWQ